MLRFVEEVNDSWSFGLIMVSKTPVYKNMSKQTIYDNLVKGTLICSRPWNGKLQVMLLLKDGTKTEWLDFGDEDCKHVPTVGDLVQIYRRSDRFLTVSGTPALN